MNEPDRVDDEADALPHASDDFYCLRYRVWYPSLDCAVRTKYETCAGCLKCDQGRFNLRRHADALYGLRFPRDVR